MALSSRLHRSNNNQPPRLLPREPSKPQSEVSAVIAQRQRIQRGRKNVSRACQACRQRRVRCTAHRPCHPCQINKSDCVDDGGAEGVDLRTIRLGPHNQKIFIEHKTLLDRLLQSIRDGTDEHIIQCVKDGGSLSDISAALRAVEGLTGPSRAEEGMSGNTGNTVDEAGKGNDDNCTAGLIEQSDTHTKSLQNFGNLSLSSAIRTNGYPSHIQDRQVVHLTRADWECSPLISDDASSGDAFSLACFSFRNLARQQLAAGADAALILSSHGIEMDLLFRGRVATDPHTVSTWACELLKTFECLTPVVQLAGAEAVACLMRWLIAPTKDHYAALPATSRPTQSQFFVPHSIGIDILMFPAIRDAILAGRDVQDWTTEVTCNTMDWHWPRSIDACIETVSRNPNSGGPSMYLSEAFTMHIRDLNNLSIDTRMLKIFPELEGEFLWHTTPENGDSTPSG